MIAVLAELVEQTTRSTTSKASAAQQTAAQTSQPTQGAPSPPDILPHWLELHIRRSVTTETVEVPVTLRKQRTVVERIAPDGPTSDERPGLRPGARDPEVS